MTNFTVTGMDSAGTEFPLGNPELALSVLEILTSVENQKLPVTNVVVRDAEGAVVDRAELIRLAEAEMRAKLIQRAKAEGKFDDGGEGLP